MSSVFECNVQAIWSIKKKTFMNEKERFQSETFNTTLSNLKYNLTVEINKEYCGIYIGTYSGTIIKEMKLSILSANFEGDLSLDSVINPEDGDKDSNVVFIKREDLLNPEKKFFVNDILEIEVRGILCPKETADFDLRNFLYKKKDKDFTFIVGNERIKIHKLILGQQSSIFDKSLDKNQFNILNFDKHVVETVVDLCYGLKYWNYRFVKNKEKEHLLKIIEFTNLYEMPAIKKQVERELIKEYIKKETVCELANKSIQHKSDTLRAYCVNFIVNCIKTGKPFDGFADLNKEIAYEVFKGTICQTQSS